MIGKITGAVLLVSVAAILFGIGFRYGEISALRQPSALTITDMDYNRVTVEVLWYDDYKKTLTVRQLIDLWGEERRSVSATSQRMFALDRALAWVCPEAFGDRSYRSATGGTINIETPIRRLLPPDLGRYNLCAEAVVKFDKYR